MSRSLRIALIIGILFTSNCSFAQSYFYKEFSLEQGLPQSEVMDAHLDSRGNLWLGLNIGGLCLLDGDHITLFGEDEGLKVASIQSIAEDGAGNLWVCSMKDGIARFDGKKFQSMSDTGGVFEVSRLMMLPSPDSMMMAVAYSQEYGVGIFECAPDETVFRPLTTDSIPKLVLRGGGNGVLDNQDQMWWAAEDGLYLYENKAFTRHPISDHALLEGKRIMAIYAEPHTDRVWFVGMQGNVCVYENGALVEKEFSPAHDIRDISGLLVDSQDRIWYIVSGAGVYCIDEDKYKSFTAKNGLPNDNISDIFEDAEGNVWVATRGNGIIKMPDEKFLNFHEDDGYSIAITDEFYEDSKGNVWIGTWQQGFSVYDGEQLQSYYTQAGMPRVLDFVETPEGQMLIAIGGSRDNKFPLLGKVVDGRVINASKEFGLEELRSPIEKFLKRGNELWLGTNGQGLLVYDFDKKKVGRRFSVQQGLNSNSIFDIDTLEDGRAVIATFTGVSIQETDTSFMSYTAKEYFEGAFCLQVAVDENQNIWFASYGKGVFVYKNGQFISLKKDRRVPAIVYSITSDAAGNMWLGAQNGIYKLVINSESEIMEVRHYTKADGFMGVESNGGGAFMDSKSRLWFGHLEGASVYDPNKDAPNETPPVTKIHTVNFNLEETNWEDSLNLGYYDQLSAWNQLPENLNLPPRKNSLAFGFSALSQKASHKINYQWRLLPIEESWRAATTKNEAVYPNLVGNDYTFEVRAQNASGVWGAPSGYSFSVRPPVTETMAFRLGIVAIVSMVTFVGFRMRINSMKAQRKRLEVLVKDRTKEVVEQNHEILEKNVELEQQKEEIASQRDLLESQFSDIERKRQIMQDALKEIEEQNVNIQASINYAQRIQEAMLPAMHEVQRDLPDIFVFFRPRDVVSGDFYWSTKVGNKTIIAAIDCTGHGVPGAFMAMSGNAYLQQVVKAQGVTDPGRILDELHRLVTTSLRQGQTLNRDGMDASICTIDWDNHTLYFAGAKNPLLYKEEGAHELLKIKGDRHSIGGHQEYKLSYETHEIQLQSGTCCYLFSDGYQDQFGGEEDRKFMSKRFRELLNTVSDQPMLQQGRIVEDTFNDWIGERSQIDDVLVIGFRVLF